MKTNFIQITKENYQDFLELDVIAFSYAFGGAMGEGGGVIIATSDDKWYHTNYAWQDFPHDLLYEIIPVLKDCVFGIFGNGSVTPEGWTYESLGCGNHLIVRSDVYEAFLEKRKDATLYPGYLYQHWMEQIKEILEGQKENR